MTNPDYAARIREAKEHQARILDMLPRYPEYGYYIKTGLAGYGPDLDETDEPVTDGWETLADVIADELARAADFAFEGAEICGTQADETGNLELYRDAWRAFKRSEELRVLAATFDNARKDAPLYAGRPELWHATIYDLTVRHFPVDVYDHSRLYIWECEGPEELVTEYRPYL